MSETSQPVDESLDLASPEKIKEFLEKRKDIETHYAQMIDAYKNEAGYLKLMCEMTEYELRNRMANMKLAQIDAEMRRAKEQSETDGKVKHLKRSDGQA